MELKTIGPYVLVDRRLNSGRLLSRPGGHNESKAALGEKSLELASPLADPDVCVALSGYVIWFAAKIDSD
jgi:hypothetical protein